MRMDRTDSFVSLRRLTQGRLIERFEEVELGCGDGAGGDGSDLGGSFGLVDCGLGLGSKKGAVALGVGVALGDGGGDPRGAGAGGRVDRRRSRRGGGRLRDGARGGRRAARLPAA